MRCPAARLHPLQVSFFFARIRPSFLPMNLLMILKLTPLGTLTGWSSAAACVKRWAKLNKTGHKTETTADTRRAKRGRLQRGISRRLVPFAGSPVSVTRLRAIHR